MAEERTDKKPQNQVVTETSTDWQFDPSALRNADVNLSQYGDDSSMKNYDEEIEWGGQAGKYTGENTKNSQIAYDPNATVEGLNPNYAYGQKAQMVNSSDANYIARRNDQIASALYNEGTTGIEDVSNFLYNQEGFQNSNENERQNTIYSIWKRLGQMGQQNAQNDEQPKEGENTPVEEGEAKNEGLDNIKSDLNKDTSGKIYGKVGTDTDGAVSTLADKNSIYAAMNESRISNFQALQGMDTMSIAASMVSGTTPYGSQALRDLMQYDPAKYAELQQKIKEIKGQNTINAITNGETISTVADTGKVTINSDINTFAEKNSSSSTSAYDILKDIKTTLNSNTGATSAEETMDNIQADMARLTERLNGLPQEAKKLFKGDVPQYIVDAYVSNRSQEIQSELKILESRYNSAMDRYQNEVKQAQWQAEYNLKLKQYELDVAAAGLNDWATRQNVMINWYNATNKDTSNTDNKTVATTSLTREEIGMTVDQLIQACENGQLSNAQCAAGIQTNYLPALGVSLGSLSSYSSKQGICNRINGDGYTPQKGDLIVMSSKSKPANGHIGIVTSVDENGRINYLDWNGDLGADGNGTEKASTAHSVLMSDAKVYGFYDPTYGGPIGGTFKNRYGIEFDMGSYSGWGNLDEGDKAIVQSILNYDYDISTLPKSGSDNGKHAYEILKAVTAIGGENYSEAKYKENYNIVNKFNNAQQAGGELSRNSTAMTELMDLYNFINGTDGYNGFILNYGNLDNGFFQPWNGIKNHLSSFLGDSGPVQFEAMVDIAASEIAGALKGNASPTEDEIKEVKKRFGTTGIFNTGILKDSKTTSQLNSIIKRYAEGIYNKAVSEAQAYKQVTGRSPYTIYVDDTGMSNDSINEWLSNFVGIDLTKNYSLQTIESEGISDDASDWLTD